MGKYFVHIHNIVIVQCQNSLTVIISEVYLEILDENTRLQNIWYNIHIKSKNLQSITHIAYWCAHVYYKYKNLEPGPVRWLSKQEKGTHHQTWKSELFI